ncbi:ABC transporter permease subunit [Variovorax sp. Sphag1AA]|uniref:ABC transporter permease subunit n=1 Tax=Variovorax sp. Sphag1AA TaxID=2587027 RepID=UPI00161D3604|nr:ABC transporter permease subunit [Variovorax sp. Sphag1AA]MBB3178192.1 general L-amino acid transport system permease protein [Variovorax sp. Sphag1AA]
MNRPAPPARWNWSAALRQAAAFALLAALLVLMFRVTGANLHARGVHTGFDFLGKPAITPVFNSPLEFQPGVDTFAMALLAGALNTLKLTAASIVLASVLGLLVGLGALARNPLARSLARAYVELMRNVPVLLHVAFWYGLLLELPPASDSAGSLLLASNRGIFLFPTVDGLDVHGMVSMSPEFAALLIGISLYTAAFIAEIVRASVGALPRGQLEAASALGLSRSATLRRVLGPQALRVGLPPLASEYIGIFKNSTLAVTIGYQDFMAVSDTMLTDTGQAVEIMAIVMLFYACVSLAVSAAMHAFEQRHRRWELA